jgi:hypothetical protein
MPSDIDADRGVVGGKVLHLPVPKAAVATPAMDKHQSGRPVSLYVVMDGNTVSGDGDMTLHMHG